VPKANTFWSEAVSAARGVGGLIVGDREVARRFELTTQGLAGSFAALLVVMGIGAGLPLLLGFHGLVLRAVVIFAISFVLQVGCAALALRQVKRLDGFVPYLVADNWASVCVTLGGLVLSLLGVPNEIIGFPVGVLMIVIAVNIGRLIIKLQPMQVAMFTVAQVVGYLLGGFLVPYLLPATTAVSS
jgi:hypothetical protein